MCSITNLKIYYTHRLLGCSFGGKLSFAADLLGTLLLRFRENLDKIADNTDNYSAVIQKVNLLTTSCSESSLMNTKTIISVFTQQSTAKTKFYKVHITSWIIIIITTIIRLHCLHAVHRCGPLLQMMHIA